MSTHHGFLREFPFIRVDAFHGKPALLNPYTGQGPSFSLLSHAHTDHLTGLDSPNFDGFVYCTAVTRDLVLGSMTAGQRVRSEFYGVRREYKFAGLRGREGGTGRMRSDKLKMIEYDVPLVLDGPNGVQVRVTAIDANHCPGSAMFLIESVSPSPPCAVLVTADVRAEPRHITFLSHHKALAPYVVQPGRANPLSRLFYVYLDTSSVLSNAELLPKQEAIRHFLRLARRYPPDTRFFLNCWTWGYEELLKAVHAKFGARVHLDGYKRRLYGSESVKKLDPVLAGLGTSECEGTRWHACERRMKCRECWGDGRGCFEVGKEGEEKWLRGKREGGGEVVYVNPVEVGRRSWDVYKRGLDDRIRAGQPLPNYLMVPLARHSSLPELCALVALFQPSSLYPLTISPSGREYSALPSLFRDQLPPSAPAQIAKEAEAYLRAAQRRRRAPLPLPASSRDVEPVEEGWEVRGGAWALNVEGGEEVEGLLGDWAEEVRRERGKRGFEEVEVDEDEVGGTETSVFWASGETAGSPPLPWAREPLASTSRANQPCDPSPELAVPIYLEAVACAGLARAPSHTTLVPATAPPSTLPPSSLLPPAQLGPPTHKPSPATLVGPTPALHTACKPLSDTRSRRLAMTRALQRSLKGLLGPGGLVVPFVEGDPRLGGRKPLTKKTRLSEDVVISVSSEQEEETWGSFRTVPPTPEQLRRK